MTISRDEAATQDEAEDAYVAPQPAPPKRRELPPDQRSPIPKPAPFHTLGLTLNGARLQERVHFTPNPEAELPLTEQEAAEARQQARWQERGVQLTTKEHENVAAAVALEKLPPAQQAQVVKLALREAERQKYERDCRIADRKKLPRTTVDAKSHQLWLTAEETSRLEVRAVQAARRRKYSQAYARACYSNTIRPEFPATLTAEQYLSLFKARADWHVQHEPKARPEFLINEHNELPIWLLCLYFAGDKRFETEYGYHLGNNLMLRGNVGTGKTTVLSMFRSNSRQSFTIVPCDSISDAFVEDGPKIKGKYYGMRPAGAGNLSWGQQQLGLVFDDLGTDDTDCNWMGNRHKPLADILSRRWNMARTLPQGATHLTTNLAWSEIRSRYKERAYSRIRSSFNDIRFPDEAPDWRLEEL